MEVGTSRGAYVEDHEEERPEMVEHLGEEVPPETGVGCQIRKQKSNSDGPN